MLLNITSDIKPDAVVIRCDWKNAFYYYNINN